MNLFEDKFMRLLFVYDQLRDTRGELWETVGKIASSTRRCAGNLDAVIAYAQSMQATYPANSKGWAVLGCCLNILQGTKPLLPSNPDFSKN